MSPEPKRRSRGAPAREALKAGRARVKRELLAETNGPHTTSELLFFPAGFSLARTSVMLSAQKCGEQTDPHREVEASLPLRRTPHRSRTSSKKYPWKSARIRGKEVFVLTSPNSPARPPHKSVEFSAPGPAVPETPHAVHSGTNTRPKNNYPTGGWRAHAQWSPATIS